MCEYVQGNTVPAESRGNEWLGTGILAVGNHLGWALGTEIVLSSRAGCDLNGWVMSPAPLEHKFNYAVRRLRLSL